MGFTSFLHLGGGARMSFQTAVNGNYRNFTANLQNLGQIRRLPIVRRRFLSLLVVFFIFLYF